MRNAYLLLIFIVLGSCSSDSLTDKKKELDYRPLIETIKMKSHLRKKHFNLDSIDFKLKPIDTVLIKTYFNGLTVSNIKDFKFEFDPYSRYFYFDYVLKDRLVLFSIIHNDEVGYDNLFHFIYDASKNKLLSTDLLGQSGGDGGHGQIEIFDYSSRGDKLKLTTVSSMDEDFDLGYTQVTDSIITTYIFGIQGTIQKNVTKTTRIDTIWSKEEGQ